MGFSFGSSFGNGGFQKIHHGLSIPHTPFKSIYRNYATLPETKKQQAAELECRVELEGLKRRQASVFTELLKRRQELERQQEQALEEGKKQQRTKYEETKKQKVREEEELRQRQAIHYEKWKEEKKSQEAHRIPPTYSP